jgi:hypothetical protein
MRTETGHFRRRKWYCLLHCVCHSIIHEAVIIHHAQQVEYDGYIDIVQFSFLHVACHHREGLCFQLQESHAQVRKLGHLERGHGVCEPFEVCFEKCNTRWRVRKQSRVIIE